MKKLLAMLLVIAMVMSFGTAAFAEETEEPVTKLTINDISGYGNDRSYEAYQILDASIKDTNYAYQVNEKYKAVLIEALELTETATDAQIIAAIQTRDTAEEMRHFSDDLCRLIIKNGIENDAAWIGSETELVQGYWLIVDKTDLEGTNYANSVVMVDTVGDVAVTIENKPSVPTIEKKVDDEEDSIVAPNSGNEDTEAWFDVADYDIGDAVPFKVSGTLAGNTAEYDYYVFKIVDSVAEGLSYNEDSFAISVGSNKKTIAKEGTEGVDFWFTIVTENDETGKQVSQTLYVYPAHAYKNTAGANFAANKDNGGDILPVFGDAAHTAINNATYTLTYTCTLNENAVHGEKGNKNAVKLVFSNDPYSESFGETTPDTVIILTYRTIFNKVDGNNKPLAGADFELYKFIGIKADGIDTENAKKIEDIKTAEDTEKAAAEKTILYHYGTKGYGYYERVDKKAVNTEGTSFTFSGLDDGYYRIVESNVPEGYNGIAPIDFHIIADHDNAWRVEGDGLNGLTVGTGVAGQLNMTPDVKEGSLTTAIQNHSGTELPSTGGIGTTILYIVGGILVLGAAVLLITKKRMAKED
ncbi:MAG: isopeptide-forming domain-containing fimbrial protein [Christensenellaceae bacterium]|nr:isopeptide-forming domain-containing fimbrial protein [Christensenellaceae bacterium]